MGYDVSFHPISPEEMQEWYFTPLPGSSRDRRKRCWPCHTAWDRGFLCEKNIWIPCGSGETEPTSCLIKAMAFTLR